MLTRERKPDSIETDFPSVRFGVFGMHLLEEQRGRQKGGRVIAFVIAFTAKSPEVQNKATKQ